MHKCPPHPRVPCTSDPPTPRFHTRGVSVHKGCAALWWQPCVWPCAHACVLFIWRWWRRWWHWWHSEVQPCVHYMRAFISPLSLSRAVCVLCPGWWWRAQSAEGQGAADMAQARASEASLMARVQQLESDRRAGGTDPEPARGHQGPAEPGEGLSPFFFFFFPFLPSTLRLYPEGTERTKVAQGFRITAHLHLGVPSAAEPRAHASL